MVTINKVVNNTRYAVFRAYKQLLRIQKDTFKEAKRKTHEEFLKNKDEIDTNKIQEYINKANEVTSMLQKNIAQAVMEPSGNRFKIKLHEKHEFGDNESIKNPPSIKTLKSQMAGKCN